MFELFFKFKKNRNEVVRTIQEITKFDEFTINQAIEACQDRDGLYSMDQVLNILMDEVSFSLSLPCMVSLGTRLLSDLLLQKYSNDYQHQDSGGSKSSGAGYRSQNDEATASKYRGTTASTSKAK